MATSRETCTNVHRAVEVGKTYEWAWRNEREQVTVVKVMDAEKPEVVCKPVFVEGPRSGFFLTDLCLFGAEIN